MDLTRCGRHQTRAEPQTSGTLLDVHARLASLAGISNEARDQIARSQDYRTSERVEAETIDILKRLSRRPISPTGDSELLADLGFDSLQVLELVGELEEHFSVAIPLNALTHIRTVSQIAAEVERLAREGAR
jgi:acyl carrier protein